MRYGLFMSSLAAAALAVGCASSSIVQRKNERSAAYARLTPDLRADVDRGEIREGMDSNAVYIAWGKPTRVESVATPAGDEVRWEYWRKWTRHHPYWSIEPGPGGYYPTAEYRPTTSSWKYLSAWVAFRGERVIRWRLLPQPPF